MVTQQVPNAADELKVFRPVVAVRLTERSCVMRDSQKRSTCRGTSTLSAISLMLRNPSQDFREDDSSRFCAPLDFDDGTARANGFRVAAAGD
jgi:hypothetical protein